MVVEEEVAEEVAAVIEAIVTIAKGQEKTTTIGIIDDRYSR